MPKLSSKASEICFICSYLVCVSEQVLTSHPLPTDLHGFVYLGFEVFNIRLSAQTMILRSLTLSGPANFTTSTKASNTLLGRIILPFGNETLIFWRFDAVVSSSTIISPVTIDTKSTFNPSSNSSDIFIISSLFRRVFMFVNTNQPSVISR